MTTLMNQLQARIETAVNKTGTYNEALQNLANLYGVPQGETGSRLIPVVQVFDPTINNATAAQNYLLYNSTIVSGGVPSLGLDFTSGVLDPRVTFTRASTATRVNAAGLIESVAINGPRFDYDPATLAPKGLLIEEQRTNLVTYSSEFDNAAWSKNTASITTNTVVAPDGTLTADKMVTNVGTALIGLNNNIGTFTAGTNTQSIFVKVDSGVRYVQLLWSSGSISTDYANFDLQTGLVTAGTYTAASAVLTRNNWYRLSLTSTVSAVAGGMFIAAIPSATSARAAFYTGDGISGIYLWGAQLEAGAFATSYIPTVASQVTRSTDNASMTGANFSSWYNATEGTLFAQASAFGLLAAGNGVVGVSDGTQNNRFGIYAISTNNAVSGYMRTSGTTEVDLSVNTAAASAQVFESAFSYKLNDFAFSANGATPLTDTSGIVATTDRLVIGAIYAAGTNLINGHIRRIMYYNTRLTNAQLQALTS
jgi:hypothetical protein